MRRKVLMAAVLLITVWLLWEAEALREAGIAYAIDQISDLVAAGVDGIHLYTMNNPAVARQISDSVSAIRRV